jgi:hypothetical protein
VIPSARAAVGEVVNHVRVALVRGDALSVEELRRRAPFPICVPTWLPDGLQVVGGNVLGTDQVVRISFDPGRTGGNSGVEGASGNGSDQPRPSAIVRFARAHNSAAGGGIHQMPGAERGRYTVPLDQAKNVQVHGRPAVFAAGAWEMTENGTRWNPGLAAGLLSWSGDGVANALTFSGLSLSREEVIRIAESCVP